METDFRKLTEQLEKKIGSYGHWPDSRKLGNKLLPFAESEELVFFLANILKDNRLDDHPELDHAVLFFDPSYRSYCTFIHIFIQYVIYQKEKFQEIISVLEYVTDKAIDVVMNDEWDNKYYMLRYIYNLYRKEKFFPVELLKKFEIVPNDKLRFILVDGDTAYEVQAYSSFTSGAIKIPSTYNGKPVKYIYHRGFESSGITDVEMPEGIEVINIGAFSNTKIKTIKFPKSLKSIKKYAFSSCRKLTGNVFIPKTVEEMEEEIFWMVGIENIQILIEGHTEKPDTWADDWNANWKSEFHNVIWNYSQ